jgi:transcriptional regulator with XRE-family HTH domain
MTLLAVPQSELVRQLHTYRVKVGLSQADIAWKLGFAVPTVSRWERGVATPDLRAIGAIVDFLRRADAHTEKALIRAVMTAKDSRNMWQGEDIRYLAGSPREYAETPQMRSLVGESIRHHMTGLYNDYIEDRAVVASLKAGEIASVDFYGGAAMSMTRIPEGFVQRKTFTFQSEIRGIIRSDTRSLLIPVAEAPMMLGVVSHTWDELSRPH